MILINKASSVQYIGSQTYNKLTSYSLPIGGLEVSQTSNNLSLNAELYLDLVVDPLLDCDGRLFQLTEIT